MRRRQGRTRRGVVLVVLVLILSLMHLMVMGSIAPAQSEAEVASLRVETLRAFYAAESGVLVLAQRLSSGGDPIEAGTAVDLVGGTVLFEAWPDGESAEAVVEGRSGRAVRRVEVLFE